MTRIVGITQKGITQEGITQKGTKQEGNMKKGNTQIGRMQKVKCRTEKAKKQKRHLVKSITQKTSAGTQLALFAGNFTLWVQNGNRQETVSSLLNQAIRLLSNDRSNYTNQQQEHRKPYSQCYSHRVADNFRQDHYILLKYIYLFFLKPGY